MQQSKTSNQGKLLGKKRKCLNGKINELKTNSERILRDLYGINVVKTEKDNLLEDSYSTYFE
jgi:hypothetical protein